MGRFEQGPRFFGKGRKENIRLVAEVARLFAGSALAVITSFISPCWEEREFIRRLHKDSEFYFSKIFIDTPIEVCETRDPKGQYARARKGELRSFTGVDAPYEPPLTPEMIVKTADNTPEEIVEQRIHHLGSNGFLPKRDLFNAPEADCPR